MKQKGRLQVGMDADIVVFDPVTAQDMATYEQPNQTSVGMRDVLPAAEPNLEPHGRRCRRESVLCLWLSEPDQRTFGTAILRARKRDASVVGLIPSRSAAPPRP